MSLFIIKSLAIVAPRTSLDQLTADISDFGPHCARIAAENMSETLGKRFPPMQLRRLDTYAKTALLAAHEALLLADLPTAPAGLVVCTGFGPVPASNAFLDTFLDHGPEGASPTFFSQTVHNMAASALSLFLGIDGPTLTVSQPDLGVSSALLTIKCWQDEGRADCVLLGAVESSQAFTRILLGTLPPALDEAPSAAFAVLNPNLGFDTSGVMIGIEEAWSKGIKGLQGGETLHSQPTDVVATLLRALRLDLTNVRKGRGA